MTWLLLTSAAPLSVGTQVHGSAITTGSVSPATLWDVSPPEVQADTLWYGDGSIAAPWGQGFLATYTPLFPGTLTNGFRAEMRYINYYGEDVSMTVTGWVSDPVEVTLFTEGDFVRRLRLTIGASTVAAAVSTAGYVVLVCSGSQAQAFLVGEESTSTITLPTPSPLRGITGVTVGMPQPIGSPAIGPLLISTVDDPLTPPAFWTDFVNAYEIP